MARKKQNIEETNVDTNVVNEETETVETKQVEQVKPKTTKKTLGKKFTPKKLKLDDDDEVLVKSNVHGLLYYKDKKTGTVFEWTPDNNEQFMKISDLKSMKATQQKFFEQNWISLIDIDTKEEVEHMLEVYQFLRVDQFYKNVGVEIDFEEVLTRTPSQIEDYVNKLSKSLKSSFIAFVADKIESGEFDSIAKKRAIEKALGMEFAEYEY